MRRNLPLDLHHRGQRLLRPDQGPVLADGRRRLEAEERRRQRPAADRHLRARDRARRVVRRALVLGRQEAAAVDPQGGDRAPRHGDDRRHLAVRDLQRPRGLDQELRLREGPRRAARRDQLRAVLRGHHRRVRAGHDDRGEDARRLAAAAARSSATTTTRPTRCRRMRLLHETARRGEFATGVIYVEPDKDDFITRSTSSTSRWRRCRSRPDAPVQGRARRGHGEPPVARSEIAPADLRTFDRSNQWNVRSPSSSPTPSRPARRPHPRPHRGGRLHRPRACA